MNMNIQNKFQKHLYFIGNVLEAYEIDLFGFFQWQYHNFVETLVLSVSDFS